MKKFLLSIVAVAVFAASCNTSLTVQKKQHSNGYYVSLSTKDRKTQTIETGLTKAKTQKTPSNVALSSTAQMSVGNSKSEAVQGTKAGQTKSQSVEAKTVVAATGEKSGFAKKVAEQKAKVMSASIKKKALMSDNAILYILLAIIIPFVAVGLATDWNVRDVVINLLLCLLCYIPGVVHAFMVCKRQGVI